MLAAYIGLAIVVLVVLWVIVTNNSFVRAWNKVDESWSGVDVQLKRRHDLVPNLVETVRGYAEHERSVLERVTEARAAAMGADDRSARSSAEGALSSALGEIRAVAEQYPELRAADNFRALQGQLAEIEDEIQAARRIYNSNVEDYNTRIQIFPNSLLAGKTWLRRDFFELESPAERAVPAVSFG